MPATEADVPEHPVPARPAAVRGGVLHGGLPELVAGSGPAVVLLGGLTAEHVVPTGLDRWVQLRMVRPIAERCTVHLVGRRPGLARGTTMADLAADVAGAIRHHFDGPVPLAGVSTGGSIALQVAVDHPDVVDRLVLLAAACRLSPHGRDVQRRLAELTIAGRPRRAWAVLGAAIATTRAGAWATAAMMWSVGRAMDPDDPSDLLAAVRAEDAFDAGPHLHRVAAPALVVGGARDRFYSPELFRETAAGIPGARLLLYPHRGHWAVAAHRPALAAVADFLAAGTSPAPPDEHDEETP